MDSEDEPLGATAILLTITLVAISILGFRLIPNQFLMILIAWILTSIPVGVLVGHCVLSEDRTVFKTNFAD